MAQIALIDGANILHRAYFGARIFNPDLTADDAIRMAQSMVLKNLRELRIDVRHTLMAGEGGKTWRHDLFPAYKDGRKDKDAVLSEVLDRGYDALREIGIKLTTIEGFEADDVIATYADMLDNEYYDTVIITGDKDLLQCITGTTSVHLLRPNGPARFYRPSDFRTEYSFSAPLFPHYKALLGDKSDAIPGVDQIGEKRARQLVAAYGRIERIYERVADEAYTEPPLTKLVRGYLETGREIAFRNLPLMMARRDVPGVSLKGR